MTEEVPIQTVSVDVVLRVASTFYKCVQNVIDNIYYDQPSLAAECDQTLKTTLETILKAHDIDCRVVTREDHEYAIKVTETLLRCEISEIEDELENDLYPEIDADDKSQMRDRLAEAKESLRANVNEQSRLNEEARLRAIARSEVDRDLNHLIKVIEKAPLLASLDTSSSISH